jgi:hypothetical protein
MSFMPTNGDNGMKNFSYQNHIVNDQYWQQDCNENNVCDQSQWNFKYRRKMMWSTETLRKNLKT